MSREKPDGAHSIFKLCIEGKASLAPFVGLEGRESLILEGRRFFLQKGKRSSLLGEHMVVEQISFGQKWEALEKADGGHEATEAIFKGEESFWSSSFNNERLRHD